MPAFTERGCNISHLSIWHLQVTNLYLIVVNEDVSFQVYHWAVGRIGSWSRWSDQDIEEIIKFVSQAKQQQLLCGLAGSLRITDINNLFALNPDYLGFRGALCKQHNRVAQLDSQAIMDIQKAVKNV